MNKKVFLVIIFNLIFSPICFSQDIPTHMPEINQKIKENKIDYFNLSTKDFFTLYSKTIENSLNRNPKVGKPQKKGYAINGLKSGTFTYYCTIAGWDKVKVEMIYSKYCDFDFSVSGTIILDLNWSANGTMKGTIDIHDPIKSTVEYSLLITKGEERGGNYILTMQNNKTSVIPWNFTLDKANRSFSIDKVN